MTETVRTDWFITASGRRMYALAPDPEEITIEDIAHALANLCRFGGHARVFYCPTPEQRVLTADLRWVAAGDLAVGTELVGFDENPHQLGACGKPRRRFRPSVVLTSAPVKRRIIRLVLASGETIRSSAEHPWLIATKASRNQKWCPAGEIAEAVRGGRRRYLHRFISPWSELSGYAAGWLAGIYDGEGSFSIRSRKGCQLAIAQLPGVVLDCITKSLADFGFLSLTLTSCHGVNGNVVNIQTRGGWRENLRLLGSVRPIRLVDKFSTALRTGDFDKQLDGTGEPGEIVAAYDEGEGECAGLETSSRTYLCEGFGAHNSVAQHSVHVSHLVPTEFAMAGLMHDATEAYLGDVIRPIKRQLGSAYADLEAIWWAAICERFDLLDHHLLPEQVKHADHVALMTERRDLVPAHAHRWVEDAQGYQADPGAILPWSPLEARVEFLSRWQELS